MLAQKVFTSLCKIQHVFVSSSPKDISHQIKEEKEWLGNVDKKCKAIKENSGGQSGTRIVQCKE